MKKHIFIITALALLSCGGGNSNQSQNNIDSTSIDGEKLVSTKTEDQLKYEQQPPYDVDNNNGQYVDTLKPTLIVMSGYSQPTDTKVADLDPTSIKSMREYADTKNDILCREFGRIYDFSQIKWDKEQRDIDGHLIFSEFKETIGEEYDSYKIKYTNEPFQTIMKVTRKFRQEGEEDLYEGESSYTLTQTYLRTDVIPE